MPPARSPVRTTPGALACTAPPRTTGGQFGTDDDLSNFWPGTRKDYLDSLNQ